MYQFRSLPAAIDRVICGNCGKPAWDHFVSTGGSECDGSGANGACRYFALTGFRVTVPVLADDVRLSQRA